MDCKVTCGCGEIFTTRATQTEINVEICSKCHPFFTGKQKLVDTAGRVEKFQRRYAKFQAQGAAAAGRRRTGSGRSAGGQARGGRPARQPPLRRNRPPPRRTESAISAVLLGTPGR